MAKPRIRHIAINTQDREKLADYYKEHFDLEEKSRGENGTIYLSDGFVDVALISSPNLPYGINHFGFVVDSVKAVEESTKATANSNTYGAIAESWIRDPEENRVDVSEHGWPV
jgi:catechol 2,3-dioxygenase-like lactoylglutathione lyase family enzyme